MIYLSGKVNISQRHPQLGFILTFGGHNHSTPPSGAMLAADNGCFRRPELYSDDAYLTFLDRLPRDRTLFATAPDSLADHAGTVAKADASLHLIRGIGHKAAFVAQDGWCEETTPWDKFDALFVGGSTAFKFRGGRAAVAAAKKRGKWCHMGRVNSLDRLRAAVGIGCNSADGTFIAFGPDRRGPEVLSWLDNLAARAELLDEYPI